MKFNDYIAEILNTREFSNEDFSTEVWDIIAYDSDNDDLYAATISRRCGNGEGCIWTEWETVSEVHPMQAQDKAQYGINIRR